MNPPSPHPSGPPLLRLRLDCDFSQVRPAAEAVHAFLVEQRCRESEWIDCELALVEACNNAIKYADAAGRRQPVRVEVLCAEHDIALRITDHTAGFEWPAQFKLPHPESERGRGLYLIHSLMDDAAYVRGAGENTLLLRKRRSNP